MYIGLVYPSWESRAFLDISSRAIANKHYNVPIWIFPCRNFPISGGVEDRAQTGGWGVEGGAQTGGGEGICYVPPIVCTPR